jgi:aerobic-type carbon monoxide dehydrogenase small subunit (CoxS/CutS family)
MNQNSNSDKQSVTFQVNGVQRQALVLPEWTLLDVLRQQLGLFGARSGCGVGMCGACTVLLDGRPISGCLTLAVQANGRSLTTVEGLAEDGRLHPVQQAYLDHYAFQCAYCTPGFILATVALLEEHPAPDDETVREYLAGNLCRCGSYPNILQAVRACRTITPQEDSTL